MRALALACLVPLGAALLATGCASGAKLETRPVLSQRGAENTTDLRIAETALESGDMQLAISLFERALKADPRSLVAQLGLADAMYETGDLARAGVLYRRVAGASPGDARAQLGLARVALRERHLDDAVTRYRVLVSAQPDNVAAAEGLGTALDLQGRHAAAQAVYRAALERHPEAHGLKADLGLSLILARAPREGANVLLDIASLPDAPAQARQNLALAYGLLGNSEAAKRILVADLPAASAEDNLQFYRNVRERLAATGGDGAARIAPVPAPGGVPSSGGAE
ncbi:tetratricopeptide repeat protein [Trinickia caryophylli]|nr:tetratricopeptide repeat protein [Trinickia caryophylli]WQE13720.1 tetratricopeptide repeat protein [Trinickia caryophylli]